MNKLIERYVYDVTRRLNENERNEVAKELESIIADMLPDEANEQQISDALTKLGDPRLMAEQYRDKPRYLISPAMFDAYLQIMKLVIPIVAVVLAGVSAFATVFDTSRSFSAIYMLTNMVHNAVSGALQAAFWITAGFAIADYTGAWKKEWTIADLPEKPNFKEVQISRTSSIGEIIATIFFTIIFIVFILRSESLFIFIRSNVDVPSIINPFSSDAMLRFIPFLIITSIMSLAVSCFKLYYARWTFPLFIINTAYNVIWLSIMLYVINWPDLFNPDFPAIILPHFDNPEFLLRGIESGGRLFRIIFASILIFAGILDTLTSAVYTWKGRREQGN